MPRELLGSIPHWNLGEIGYDMEECLSNGVDELVGEREGKPAKPKSFPVPCPFMWATTRSCGLDLDGSSYPSRSQFKVGLPTPNDTTRKIPIGMSNAWFWLIQMW